MPVSLSPRVKKWKTKSSVSSFSTPAPLLQLQYGQPLFLTPEILRLTSSSLTSPGVLRYPHFWGLGEKLPIPPLSGYDSAENNTLREYCQLDDRASILLLRDISNPPSKTGSEASSTALSFDTWFGIRKSTPTDYMKSVQAWAPDMAVSFHDEINRSAGSNRTRACVDRASHWLQECVDFQTKQSEASSSQSCALPALLAFLPCVADTVGRNFAIEKILSIVKRSSQHDMSIDHGSNGSTSSSPSQMLTSSSSSQMLTSLKSSIAGFVFGCLGQGETNQERIDILSDVIPKVPETQLRVISGVTTPFDILDCIALGIDIFDSDYPNLLTSAGLAATFYYKYNNSSPDSRISSKMLEEDYIGSLSQSSSSPRHERHVEDNNDEGEKEEEVLKRKRNPAALTGTQMAEALVLERSRQILSNDPLPRIYLRSSRFLDDESPLVSSCECFACSGLSKEKAAEMLPTTKDKRPISHPGHMRCYVNHLLETGELLGHVLLTTHNVYHFNAFFAEIRKSIEEGYFVEYKAWFRNINTNINTSQ